MTTCALGGDVDRQFRAEERHLRARRSTCRRRAARRTGSARRPPHPGSRRSSSEPASGPRRPDPAPRRSRRPSAAAAPGRRGPLVRAVEDGDQDASICGLGVTSGAGWASWSGWTSDGLVVRGCRPPPLGGGTTARAREPVREDGDAADDERHDDHDPCGTQIHAAHPTLGVRRPERCRATARATGYSGIPSRPAVRLRRRASRIRRSRRTSIGSYASASGRSMARFSNWW